MRTGHRTLVILAAAAVAVGCETPTPTDTAIRTTGTRIAASNGVTAHASGSAHRESQGKPIVLSFSARLRADGTAEGSYFYHAVATHTTIEVDVTCMTIVNGNQAFIAGIIEDSSIPSLIGTVSYFYTKDNGEGANAPPDEVSLVRANDVPGADEEFCTTLPTVLPNREVLHGNVQVKS